MRVAGGTGTLTPHWALSGALWLLETCPRQEVFGAGAVNRSKYQLYFRIAGPQASGSSGASSTVLPSPPRAELSLAPLLEDALLWEGSRASQGHCQGILHAAPEAGNGDPGAGLPQAPEVPGPTLEGGTEQKCWMPVKWKFCLSFPQTRG